MVDRSIGKLNEIISQKPLFPSVLYDSTKFEVGKEVIIDMNINKKEKEILCSLAGEIADLASRPIEAEKRDLWYKHNSLESVSPVVLCDPENGWNEIITEDQLQCEGKLARQWEFRLRRKIFWGKYMGDDMVIEPIFLFPMFL